MKDIKQAILEVENSDIEKDLKKFMLDDMRSMPLDVKVDYNLRGWCIYKLHHTKLAVATIHNGHHVPPDIDFYHTYEERRDWEDHDTGNLYKPLFLKLGGIFINVYVSRYFCDLNRTIKDACFLHKAPLGTERNFRPTEDEDLYKKSAAEFYHAFYEHVMPYLKQTNYLFSGHSMRPIMNGKTRKDFIVIFKDLSQATPFVDVLSNAGYSVSINEPFTYEGGNFRVYYDSLTQNKSIEFETNRKLYNDNFQKTQSILAEKISPLLSDLANL
ncbi:MAG: N-formylglutamate amidohydrolase [Candidatus Woesearchaeota archaeon]